METNISEFQFPVVAKVVGPIHKTEVNGVVVNIQSEDELRSHFNYLIRIDDAKGVLVQQMLKGVEVYIGAKYEEGYGHLIMFGLGGVLIEVMRDISSALTPVTHEEVKVLLRKLKGYKILEGYRNQPGVDIEQLIEVILRVSALVRIAPQIKEMDINPLIANENFIKAVDVRIKL